MPLINTVHRKGLRFYEIEKTVKERILFTENTVLAETDVAKRMRHSKVAMEKMNSR